MKKDKETIGELYELLREEIDEIIADNSNYENVRKKCSESEEKLRNRITREEYRLVEKFLDDFSELTEIQTKESFITGFSIANKYRDESIR